MTQRQQPVQQQRRIPVTRKSYLHFGPGPRETDHVTYQDGVRVLVDPKSMRFLKGTTIHFETGMRGHGFNFENPNVDDSCGCGESITF